jgi:hydroxyacylglutathione hydrolase
MGMSKIEIHLFVCRDDNYGVLLHDPGEGVTATVDTPDPEPIRQALYEKGWMLTHILTTHHHYDHVEGHAALKAETGATIIGAARDRERIPGLDAPVSEGDELRLGSIIVKVMETPGHTLGHLCYWLPEEGVLFTGDTLFSLGCGRLFEGTAEMMWSSLDRIRAAPPETLIYCGHEYTEAHSRFALTIEPENEALRNRADEVVRLRREGKPTIPVPLSVEIATNPFLRPESPDIQKRLGMEGAPHHEIFAEIRRRKDVFR